ncbi:MAG: hypothetical protein J07AB43_08100 [Candidatus Nanosalina sp. J07AB43]|nr:MAG: hypothetical protein J07AB43_08100 [Candidatus Nanosalina sp. J07AB43]
MKYLKIEDLLRRLKVEFFKINLIQASLDAIILFLALNLSSFLLSLQLIGLRKDYYLLGGISILFFIGDLLYRAKTYHLELYEQKNPELKEILRTARDNIDRSNTVSEALFEEVLSRTRKVTSESIIPSRKIIQKILAIGLLCFLTVGSGLVDFQLRNTTNNLVDQINSNLNNENSSQTGEPRRLNRSGILGEPSNISSVERKLDFDIQGSGKSEESELNYEAVEGDLMRSDSNGDINTENLDLAKRYSLEIKKFD